jgi:hypothetical protein
VVEKRAVAAAVRPAARGSVAVGSISTVEIENRISSGTGSWSAASGEAGALLWRVSSSGEAAERRAEARAAELRVR